VTDKALDDLATAACNPKVSKPELRRVALVAIGELSMLRREYAALREQGALEPDYAYRARMRMSA
jgi:heterodisulfide reductase subunit A-like polyferredoxin